ENTRLWVLAVLPVSFVAGVPLHVTVPVDRVKFRVGGGFRRRLGAGGQSWLVGNPLPRLLVAGTQFMPLLGPPIQVPAEQSGQGWMPGIVLPGSVDVSPVR